jgi:hypothetical protein
MRNSACLAIVAALIFGCSGIDRALDLVGSESGIVPSVSELPEHLNVQDSITIELLRDLPTTSLAWYKWSSGHTITAFVKGQITIDGDEDLHKRIMEFAASRKPECPVLVEACEGNDHFYELQKLSCPFEFKCAGECLRLGGTIRGANTQIWISEPTGEFLIRNLWGK